MLVDLRVDVRVERRSLGLRGAFGEFRGVIDLGANALVETADGTVSVPLDNIERARLVPKIEWRRDR